MKILVRKQRGEVTWKCCGGLGSKSVLGELAHALQQLEVATLSCCSGLGGMGVPGTATRVEQQLRVGI
jgi:hypothetical protein